jgi:hypothetical protein
MPKPKESWQSEAAKLGHLRTEIAKKELAKILGRDFHYLSKGYPDVTAFNPKTGTFYFVECKSEKEMGKPLSPEQEKMKRILNRICKKGNNYEVWYFSDKKGEKDKILVKCFCFGKRQEPYYPKPLNPELAEKFKV